MTTLTGRVQGLIDHIGDAVNCDWFVAAAARDPAMAPLKLVSGISVVIKLLRHPTLRRVTALASGRGTVLPG